MTEREREQEYKQMKRSMGMRSGLDSGAVGQSQVEPSLVKKPKVDKGLINESNVHYTHKFAQEIVDRLLSEFSVQQQNEVLNLLRDALVGNRNDILKELEQQRICLHKSLEELGR